MCIITNSLNSRRLHSIIIIIAVETLVSLLLSGPCFQQEPLSSVSMRSLVLLLLLLAVVVGGQVIRDVNNHNTLFHAISNAAWSGGTTGNSIVPNGAILRAAQGTFTGTLHSGYGDAVSGYGDSMYGIDNRYFSLICSSSPHSCILDGRDIRRIMYISGTSSQTLTVAGMAFEDGDTVGGGGMAIMSSARVSIQTCKFVSCYAYGDGGGAIYAEATVNIYTTTFADNSVAFLSSGRDIGTEGGGDVTIRSTCPPSWTGNPTTGSGLDASEIFWLGGIKGPENSFSLG